MDTIKNTDLDKAGREKKARQDDWPSKQPKEKAKSKKPEKRKLEVDTGSKHARHQSQLKIKMSAITGYNIATDDKLLQSVRLNTVKYGGVDKISHYEPPIDENNASNFFESKQ